MKNYEITKEQIDLAYNSACSEWKERIKQWFPDAFKEELDAGYYFATCYGNDGYLCYFKNPNDKNLFAEFYIINGNYYEKGHFSTIERKATPQEIETALINEAKKRGFVEGVTYIAVGEEKGRKTTLGSMDLRYGVGEKDALCSCGYPRIYYKGKWAEIVSKPTVLTRQQIADKFNIDVNNLEITK